MGIENKFNKRNAILVTSAITISLAGGGCATKQEQPVAISTNQIMPSATTYAELIRTTPEATESPKPTPTLTATYKPLNTETPKPIEKSPLPRYGTYMGTLSDNKGVIIIASIPTNNPDKDQIYVYLIEQFPNGGKSMPAYIADPTNIHDKSFQADKMPGAAYRLKATLNDKDQTLTGKWERGKPGSTSDFESEFKANYTGSGRQYLSNDISKALSQIKLGQSLMPDISLLPEK